MKKFFKVLIPILLAVVLIACLWWYFFRYDRDFTRDALLYGARWADQQGHGALSSWFYDRAYDMARDNDQVAIELAQQHKLDGNYTQAENTLARAIEDGGSVDLYIALCKTYIEQDKILDAVKLLNGITNAETKAQIDALRPMAPVASPAPGFYNQYISVSVAGEGGTLYVNPIAEYPSVYDAPYAAPVVLHDGENTIYAVTVAENGLVSPLSIFGYTVGGIIEEVNFADQAVEAEVRRILELDEEEIVMSNQLWDITSFTLPAEAATMSDMKYMLFLEELVIDNGPTGELSLLSSYPHLKSLYITDTAVTTEELGYIGALTGLETLSLSGCSLATTSPLEGLTGLTYLDLSNNTIRNIQALSGMTGLQELNLHQNALTDLTALQGLQALRILDISSNAVSSLSPLLGLNALTWLDASVNQLTALTDIGNLTALSHLNVSSNLLTDVSPLAACTGLTSLDMSTNSITDITMLKDLVKLTDLRFSYNQVVELPAFPVDCALVTIDGSHNLIESLKPLGGLLSLNSIFMDYNEEISTLEWLAKNLTLVQVNVYGTKVNELHQVALLTDHSIIVNFTPLQEEDN